MKEKKLVFLIPTLNEEKAIPKTIESIKKINIDMPYEIVIVDGGSSDKTTTLAKEHGAKVILSAKGYGRQYYNALKEIKADYIITGDADCTYPFDIAYEILKEWIIDKGFDFITTNRFANLSKESMSFSHILGNKILTITTNLLFGLKLKDSQSGMWIFRKSVYDKEFNMIGRDMDFSEEIKIEAFMKLKKVKEVPIEYYKRVGESKLNYKHAIKNFLFLFKKRLLLKNKKLKK